MSEFTEKSDFYDWCNIRCSPQEVIFNADIYLNGARVDIRDEKDLIPYYTHLSSVICVSNGRQIIQLSNESEIDREEKITVGLKVLDCFQWRNLARELNEKFDFYFIQRQKNYWSSNENLYKQILYIMNHNEELDDYIFPKSWREKEELFVNYFIPYFFDKVHTSHFTQLREKFIQYADENGYRIFDINCNEFRFNDELGFYSPIIISMAKSIQEFEEMRKLV